LSAVKDVEKAYPYLYAFLKYRFLKILKQIPPKTNPAVLVMISSISNIPGWKLPG
jgi:hypothetical protein